jgi:hypothetical protein
MFVNSSTATITVVLHMMLDMIWYCFESCHFFLVLLVLILHWNWYLFLYYGMQMLLIMFL